MKQVRDSKLFVSAWRDLDAAALATANIQGKGDLATQAGQEIDRLRRAVNGPNGPNPSDVIGSYNQAARAFYLNGRADRAYSLLRAALAVCQAGWERTGSVVWRGCMLGPYTFFGRMAALNGDAPFALETYRSLYEFLCCAAELKIGGTVLTAAMLQDLIETSPDFKGLRAGAASVYLIEGAKAILLQHDYERLLEFIDRSTEELRLKEASRRHRLAVLEIRARALAGLCRYDDALDVYAEIRGMMPAGKPAYASISARAARTCAENSEPDLALEWLDDAESLVQNSPDTDELIVSRHCAQFAIAFERYALGDGEGAFRCASDALHSALRTQRTVGVMRSRVLLNMSAAICTSRTASDDRDYRLEACERDLRNTLHGFERAAGLLHLAAAQNRAVGLISEAAGMLNWIESHGFRIPAGFELESLDRQRYTASTALDHPSLQSMYDVFMNYAHQQAPEFAACA